MKNPYANLAEQIAALIRMGVPADRLVPCTKNAAAAMFGQDALRTERGKHGAMVLVIHDGDFRFYAAGAWKWGVLRLWDRGAERLNAIRAAGGATVVKA